MVTSYMVQQLACSVGPYTMSSCMVTSYTVQQLISSVSPYTMSSVLTFVKVAGRGALISRSRRDRSWSGSYRNKNVNDAA